MKKLIPLLLILASCTDSKPTVDPKIQRKKDSINNIIECNNCQIKMIQDGVNEKKAEIYCKKLYKVK